MADFITGQAQTIGTFFSPSPLQMLQNSSQNSRHQSHSLLRPGSLPSPPPSPPSAHAELSTRPAQHQLGELKGATSSGHGGGVQPPDDLARPELVQQRPPRANSAPPKPQLRGGGGRRGLACALHSEGGTAIAGGF